MVYLTVLPEALGWSLRGTPCSSLPLPCYSSTLLLPSRNRPRPRLCHSTCPCSCVSGSPTAYGDAYRPACSVIGSSNGSRACLASS